MFEKYLEDLGLSEKEAKVYLSLLEVDNDSVLDLAEKTKINRTTIYPVLESLAKKGLISEVKVDKKVRFQAEPPERLETYVERQKIVLEEHAKRLKDVIPQLKSVQRETGERPLVKMYDGKEGIISSLEDFFETKDKGGEAYFLYSRDLIDDLVPEEQRIKYRDIRIAKNIKSKTIYSYSKGEMDKDSTADRIRVDGNKYPFLCDIVIYEDRVKITTLLKSNTAITIKSHDFAETMRSVLKLTRDSLEK
jgi:sugar-specific transcriptional regulator TrmB